MAGVWLLTFVLSMAVSLIEMQKLHLVTQTIRGAVYFRSLQQGTTRPALGLDMRQLSVKLQFNGILRTTQPVGFWLGSGAAAPFPQFFSASQLLSWRPMN